MKRFSFSLVALVCCIVAHSLQGQHIAGEKMGEKLSAQARTLNPEYLVYYPKPKPTKPVPLVIYLHGAGGVGDDIQKIKGQVSQIVRVSHNTKKNPALSWPRRLAEKTVSPGGGFRNI